MTEPSPIPDRRGEIDAKQARVAALLDEAKADGLLLLDPANVAWFGGASLHQDVADINEWPAVWVGNGQRWLVAGNGDSQRLFDQHLDGLGFQLKEWSWHRGRDRLISDLCHNRRVACDRLLPDMLPVGPTLRRLRAVLTSPEQTRLRELGSIVSHALEATGRSLRPGEPEAEIAGQLSHRLIHRGAAPIGLHVAADGRAGRHPRPGVTTAILQKTCALAVTARRNGLHVSASRSVSFGEPDEATRTAHDAACRVVGGLAAVGVTGMAAAAVFESGRRVARAAGYEHLWRDATPGCVTGWSPVERAVGPASTYSLEAGCAVTWQAVAGSALVADTFLVAAEPEAVSPAESWPIKRVRANGVTIDVPDVLVR